MRLIFFTLSLSLSTHTKSIEACRSRLFLGGREVPCLLLLLTVSLHFLIFSWQKDVVPQVDSSFSLFVLLCIDESGRCQSGQEHEQLQFGHQVPADATNVVPTYSFDDSG